MQANFPFSFVDILFVKMTKSWLLSYPLFNVSLVIESLKWAKFTWNFFIKFYSYYLWYRSYQHMISLALTNYLTLINLKVFMCCLRQIPYALAHLFKTIINGAMDNLAERSYIS